MWWAVVTLTTVGYGDVTPITPLGVFFGAIITILGVGLAALPAGILATGLTYELEQRKQNLELKFRELLQSSEIDLFDDQEKIESHSQRGGAHFSIKLADIVFQLLREQREEALKQEREQYAYCPHCGKKLPELKLRFYELLTFHTWLCVVD